MKTKIITYEEFKNAINIVHQYKKQFDVKYKEIKQEVELLPMETNYDGNTLFYDLPLSVKLHNSLMLHGKKLGINITENTRLKDLSDISMNAFLSCRHVGKKQLQELREICFYGNVTLSK